MEIRLPQDVKRILNTLERAGFEAYAVGGCVRDSILGRTPDDWDITTSAKPFEVKALFPKTFDTGIQHGTITVLMHHVGYEVTTYRIDGEYEDSRHPKEVIFTPSLLEDLKRRDFTINAMAYNEKRGLVDEFDGMNDITSKTIRCVGNPEERFTEDALRIMRAVRFSAQLGYTIDEKTQMAIARLAPTLAKISAERIQVELVKLLLSAHPEKLRELYELGITATIMPEFDAMMKTVQNNPHHCYTVGEHTIHALEETAVQETATQETAAQETAAQKAGIEKHVTQDRMLRLAVLFHDFGKPSCRTTDEAGIDHFYGHAAVSEELAKTILKRLKFDNDTYRTVTRLVFYHDYKVGPGRRGVRRAMAKMGEDIFPLLLQVKRADLLAQSDYNRDEKLKELAEIRKNYEEVLAEKECVSLKTLAITGSDLIALGMKPGKEIGETLQTLLESVIEDPALNTREQLIRLIPKE